MKILPGAFFALALAAAAAASPDSGDRVRIPGPWRFLRNAPPPGRHGRVAVLKGAGGGGGADRRVAGDAASASVGRRARKNPDRGLKKKTKGKSTKSPKEAATTAAASEAATTPAATEAAAAAAATTEAATTTPAATEAAAAAAGGPEAAAAARPQAAAAAPEPGAAAVGPAAAAAGSPLIPEASLAGAAAAAADDWGEEETADMTAEAYVEYGGGRSGKKSGKKSGRSGTGHGSPGGTSGGGRSGSGGRCDTRRLAMYCQRVTRRRLTTVFRDRSQGRPQKAYRGGCTGLSCRTLCGGAQKCVKTVLSQLRGEVFCGTRAQALAEEAEELAIPETTVATGGPEAAVGGPEAAAPPGATASTGTPGATTAAPEASCHYLDVQAWNEAHPNKPTEGEFHTKFADTIGGALATTEYYVALQGTCEEAMETQLNVLCPSFVTTEADTEECGPYVVYNEFTGKWQCVNEDCATTTDP